jgi:hypothetical protein
MAEVAKVGVHVYVHMDELETILNRMKRLQTYKMFDGDDELYVSVADVCFALKESMRVDTSSDLRDRINELLCGDCIKAADCPRRKKMIKRNHRGLARCGWHETGVDKDDNRV